MELGKRLYPGSPQAPLLAAMAAGVGGSFFRYMDRKLGRGWEDEQTELAHPTETTKRTFLYTIAYITMRKTNGLENARLWLTATHIVYCLIQQVLAEIQSPFMGEWAMEYPVRPARRNRKQPKGVNHTAKVAIALAVNTLLDLKKEYKKETGDHYSEGRKPSKVAGIQNVKLWECVKAQGDTVRQLKKKKEESQRGSLSGYSV